MSWYALLTESNKESKAIRWLERRKVQPFWPHYKSPVRLNRHRRGFRLRAVIPGYIFLPNHEPFVWPTNVDWQVVLQAPGVRSVLKHPSQDYARLSDAEIDAIRNIEIALNASELCAREGVPFRVGQRVRCLADALWQWEGPIIEIKKGRHVVVEIQLLGRATLVTMPVSEIELV